MKKNVLIILLTIFVLSCNSNEGNSGMVNIEPILIAKDNLYGNGGEGISEQNLVISDQNTWIELISQMNSVNNVSDSFSEIDIDFSEYTVIAVFDDIKPNGGYFLEMNVVSNSENIIVNINVSSPEGITTTVITQPFIIVKILNSELPILFQ